MAMKLEYTNKWKIGILPANNSGKTKNRNLSFYQNWIVFAVTLFIVGVVFGDTIGIRACYGQIFRALTAIGFAFGLIPVIKEFIDEQRNRILNIPTLLVIGIIISAFLLTLFYRF